MFLVAEAGTTAVVYRTPSGRMRSSESYIKKYSLTDTIKKNAGTTPYLRCPSITSTHDTHNKAVLTMQKKKKRTNGALLISKHKTARTKQTLVRLRTYYTRQIDRYTIKIEKLPVGYRILNYILY